MPLNPFLDKDGNVLISDQELAKLIEEVGPHRYTVVGIPEDEPLRIYVLGCHGEEGERQKAVAELMNKLAGESPPHVILFLGDNIYGGSPLSITDPRFKTHFDDVYNKLENLKNVIKLIILGNHDEGLEFIKETFDKMVLSPLHSVSNYLFGKESSVTAYVKPSPVGRAAGKFEVGRTFIENDIEKFKCNYLAAQDLTTGVMPFFHCSYKFKSGKKMTELFCLNTNDYLNHFVASYINNPLTQESAGDPNINTKHNQATWFASAFADAKAQGLTTLVALHNPILTSSKRANPAKYDTALYLPAKLIQQLNYAKERYNAGTLNDETLRLIFNESDENINSAVYNQKTTASHAGLLKFVFEYQGITPHAFFAAHDHALVYDDDADICQVISGAGGSTNLMHKFPTPQPHDATQGCFVSEAGFAAITIDHSKAEPEITTDIYTVNGTHKRFRKGSHINILESDKNATASAAAAAAPEALLETSVKPPAADISYHNTSLHRFQHAPRIQRASDKASCKAIEMDELALSDDESPIYRR